MSKVTLRIAAAIGFLVVACALTVMTGWIPRGPMNHGWDWPWHDWWHSQSQSSQVYQHGPTMDHAQMAGSVGDHAPIRKY